MQKPIRLILADDHPFVRESILAKLEHLPEYEVLGQARRGEDALKLIQNLKPDIALMDIELEGMSGLQVARYLEENALECQVIILTGFPSREYLAEALRLKNTVRGFLSKRGRVEEVLTCIAQILAGENYISSSLWEVIQSLGENPPVDFSQLTPMEIKVLKKVAEEKAARQIAEEMGISKKTVDVHRANIREKLGLKNTGEGLLVYALKHKSYIEQLEA